MSSKLPELIEAIEAVIAALEAAYTYDEVEEKRWVLGDGGTAGNCEYCDGNEEMGWIEDSEVFDSPDGDIDGPPAHPHCFLAGTNVTAIGVAAQTRRKYKGEIVLLRIPGIDQISVTPNHPILTDSGWVAAGLLKRGDLLVQCLFPRMLVQAIGSWAMPLPYPHNDYIETAIEQISGSLMVSGGMVSRGVPLAPEDFHCDGQVNGKVDIVRPASSLHDQPIITKSPRQIPPTQNPHDLYFGIRQGKRVSLARDGALATFRQAALASSDGSMSGGGDLRSSGWSPALIEEYLSSAVASVIEAHLGPSVSYCLSRYADLIGDRGDGLPSLMSFVELAEVNKGNFDGHVYNLQTADAFYVANTIIAHNCDCELEYRTRRQRVYDD